MQNVGSFVTLHVWSVESRQQLQLLAWQDQTGHTIQETLSVMRRYSKYSTVIE